MMRPSLLNRICRAALLVLAVGMGAVRAADPAVPEEAPRRFARLLPEVPEFGLPAAGAHAQARDFCNQGFAMLLIGWPAEAERAFLTAGHHDPDSALAWWGAAFACRSVPARAAPHLARALKLRNEAPQELRRWISLLEAAVSPQRERIALQLRTDAPAGAEGDPARLLALLDAAPAPQDGTAGLSGAADFLDQLHRLHPSWPLFHLASRYGRDGKTWLPPGTESPRSSWLVIRGGSAVSPAVRLRAALEWCEAEGRTQAQVELLLAVLREEWPRLETADRCQWALSLPALPDFPRSAGINDRILGAAPPAGRPTCRELLTELAAAGALPAPAKLHELEPLLPESRSLRDDFRYHAALAESAAGAGDSTGRMHHLQRAAEAEATLRRVQQELLSEMKAMQQARGQTEKPLSDEDRFRRESEANAAILARLRELPAIAPSPAQNTESGRLRPGWETAPAPDFTLPDADGKVVSLRSLAGRTVLLNFYLDHRCERCMSQMTELAAMNGAFEAAGITVVAIGGEGREDIGKARTTGDTPQPFPFPLLADPGFKTISAYGHADDFAGLPLHGTTLVSSRGRILWNATGDTPFTDLEFLLKECRRLKAVRGD